MTNGASATDSYRSLVVSALKAIGAGIGVLGFVVFAGGGLIWLRFYALNLPANYAVSLVPHNELLVTGASFLAFAAALSLAVAALGVALDSVPWSPDLPGQAAGAVLVGAAGVAFAIWFWVEDGALVFLFLIMVSAVSAEIAFLALGSAEKFVWRFVALFCAVGIYATAFQAVRTYHTPKIEPMAVVLTDKSTAVGALVAETDTGVYLAEQQSDGRWDVRRIARSKVEEQAVGALASRGQIGSHAQALLAALEAHPS